MKITFDSENDAKDHIEVMKSGAAELVADNVPHAMKVEEQWVCWKWSVSKTSKGYNVTKVPIGVNADSASTTDKETWNNFDNVLEAVNKNPKCDGIGFVFDGEEMIGVDFDNCVDEEKQIDPEVKQLIEDFDTYIEASPTKTGLKVFGYAKMPDKIKESTNGAGSGFKIGGFPKGGMDVEVYHHSRFFTVTTMKLKSKPVEIDNIQDMIDIIFEEKESRDLEKKAPKGELAETKTEEVDSKEEAKFEANPSTPRVLGESNVLDKIRASKQASIFIPLWEGNFSKYPSQSEADLALTSILCWWCQGKRSEAETLFSNSGLVREKWTDREDYRDSLWEMADSGDYYMPKELADPKDLVPILSLDRQIDAVTNFVVDEKLDDISNIRFDGYRVVVDFEFKGEVYKSILFSDVFCAKFGIPPMSVWKRDENGKLAGKQEKDYWVKINNAAAKVVGHTGGWGVLRNRHKDIASKLATAIQGEDNG